MPMESQIVNTFHSSSSFNGDSSKLVDNEGLGGVFRHGWGSGIPKCCLIKFLPLYRGCAHTERSEEDEWFSLELQESRRVTKVQIARRMDCCWEQGQNIRITIGPSQSYDPSEPLCLPEITELRREEGLQDYICTGNLHSGKYVKINKLNWDKLGLVLCEVKVFTLPNVSGKWSNLKCGWFWSRDEGEVSVSEWSEPVLT